MITSEEKAKLLKFARESIQHYSRVEAAIEAIPTADYLIENNTFWVSHELLEMFDRARHLRYLHFLSFPLTRDWGVPITCYNLSKPGYAGCTLVRDEDPAELCKVFQSLVDMATSQPANSDNINSEVEQ
jgi:hypothetical protein